MKPADSTTTPDPLATVPAEERARIDRGARACGRTKGYDTCRACIDREVRAWHAAHPARAEGLPLFDGPPRSLYQPNGPDGSPEDCDPETLTPAEEAEIIASAPGQIGPGQTPIGDAERDPCAVREGYCGALSARAMACTRKPHTDGDHVAEGAIGEVIERWTTAAARVTEDELAEIERAAKQIRDGNWPPPGAATILLCERTSDLAAEVRALRGERDAATERCAHLEMQKRTYLRKIEELRAELAARPAPAADASLEARAQLVESTLRLCGVGLLVTHPSDGSLALQAVVRAVDASRPAAAIERTLNINALARCARAALRIEVPDVVAWEALPEAERVGWRAVVRCILASTTLASRPGLTEEQADAIALGCLQVREDLQRHAIKRAILRVDRGETGPATEPTRAERVAEAQRLRAEARAEAEACTVPMPADLLARYPRSADPPQPDRPSGLTRAMHDAQTRPSVAPASPFGEWPEPAHREAAAVHPTTAPTTTKDPSR